MDEARDGELVARPHPLPPSATRKGPAAGEGSLATTSSSDGRSASGGGGGGGLTGVGAGTGPAARQSAGGSWADRAARRREARQEEAANEEWISSTRAEVAKLCEVASKPFWQVRVFVFGTAAGAGGRECRGLFRGWMARETRDEKIRCMVGWLSIVGVRVVEREGSCWSSSSSSLWSSSW